jgi:hypothetical protein
MERLAASRELSNVFGAFQELAELEVWAVLQAY